MATITPAPVQAARVLPLAGLLAAGALLLTLAVAGSTGDLTDQQVIERFVAALDRGDVADVTAVLADEPTIVTWMPVLPQPVNSATMALIDVGRADRVQAGKPLPLADYHGYYQGLGARTELLGCAAEPSRPGRLPAREAWVACGFASTNALVDLVTGGGVVLRGQVRFAVAGNEVRAVLVVAQPTQAFEPVWDFVRWVRTAHPDDFEHWLQGRLHDPVVSADGAAALRRLAAEYAAREA